MKKYNYKNMFYFVFCINIIFLILLIGAVCNFLAITENAGKMPVLCGYTFDSQTHFGISDKSEIKYPYLADILQLSFLDYISYFSFGDIFIVCAAFGMVFVVLFFTLHTKFKWRYNLRK